MTTNSGTVKEDSATAADVPQVHKQQTNAGADGGVKACINKTSEPDNENRQKAEGLPLEQVQDRATDRQQMTGDAK